LIGLFHLIFISKICAVSNMTGPIARVLTVLELLQSHKRLSGADLAEKLGVDRRTVRRYITVLEDMGVPVTTEQGRHGGYMLVPGFKLPPMMFTDEEVMAVSLGLLAARQLGLAEAAPAIESVQAKLERVMPDGLKRRARAVSEITKLMLPRPAHVLDDRLLLTLTHAAREEQRIEFTYHRPDKDPTHREADPYGLLFQHGRWYMSGYCHLRKEMRSFRLDRIFGAQILSQNFKRPAGFDAAEHFMQSLYAMTGNHRVLVILHTDAETAANSFTFCPDAQALFQHHPDGLLLDTQTDSFEWFAGWLAQLNFRFTVLEPTGLKDALRERAARLVGSCEKINPAAIS
jgi:predicted DNA-binding transcriptional regulator YafY